MLKTIKMFRCLTGILDKEGKKKCRLLTVLSFISPFTDIFGFSAVVYIVTIAAGADYAASGFVPFMLFLAVLWALKGLFEIYKCRLSDRFTCYEAQKLSEKMYDLMMKEDLLQHSAKNPMQALAMVRSDTAACLNALAACIRLWVNGFTMAGYCGILILSLQWLGFVSAVVCVLFIFGAFFLNRVKMKAYGEKLRAQEIRVNSRVTIAYGAYKEIKTSGCSQRLLKKYSDESKRAARLQSDFKYKNSSVSIMAQNGAMLLIFLLLALFVGSGGDLAGALAPLILCITALGQLLPIAYRMVEGLNTIEFAQTSYIELKKNTERYEELSERLNKRLNENFNEKLQEKEKHAPAARRKKLTLKKGIFVDRLTFCYNGGEEIFRNASLEIPAGCSAAFIGASGIGKTTFFDLLLGLIVPQEGSILYDDCNIAAPTEEGERCRESIGNIVSYIPQTVYLNGETVRNNVAFFTKEDEIDEERVIECLKCAQVWKDISKFPEGIHTIIGENGSVISGGQRQRIAMARALYKEFDLLVMDEATAALDAETEKAVIDSIQQAKRNKTILLATHHMGLADMCDRVYKIENRQIIRIR